VGNPGAYKRDLQQVQSATPGQLQSAAKQWLSDGQFVLQVLPFPEYTNNTKPADRSKLPEVAAAPAGKLPKLQRANLGQRPEHCIGGTA
jgi:zinc protease